MNNTYKTNHSFAARLAKFKTIISSRKIFQKCMLLPNLTYIVQQQSKHVHLAQTTNVSQLVQLV